jgi:hypothetical protein
VLSARHAIMQLKNGKAILSILCKTESIMSGPTNFKRTTFRWHQVQEIGMSQYVWLCGVLGWGGSTGFLWSITLALSSKNENLVYLLAVAAFFFPIGGYCWGLLNWSLLKELGHHSRLNIQTKSIETMPN